jgi:general secretion pathway protein D
MKTTTLRRVLLATSLVAGLGASQLSSLAGGGFGGMTTRTAGRGGSTSYPTATEMGTATFSVDPETRKIFVVADEETANYVKGVIQDLERPTPQVLIKCIFLEATYTKDSDFGVDGIYRYTAKGSSIDQFNGSGSARTAFDLAAGTGALGTFASAAGDLEVTLSALAKAGKTEILSRPSILARNNQPATISLGQQVPLITNSRFDNYGNQINSVSYQDVGIILSVTPFITSDKMVEMLVTPQISELADRSQWVDISGSGTNTSTAVNAVKAPVINSRSADTVVVVPDGQTVVIGGLMQNKKLNSTEKVPILGDIPLLGLLFRHKSTSNGKTELMIFLTPHIIEKPTDLVAVTASERANQQIVPKAFTEEELNQYLENLPSLDKAEK